MTRALSATDLFYLYRTEHGDVAALRGLQLEVNHGEVVTVLGPSGSGKSTLLELSSGHLQPSSGTLTVLGTPLERATSRERARLRRLSIGVIRQHYHRTLPHDLTVEDIVGLPLRLLGRTGEPSRRRVAALLKSAGIEHRRGARAVELSGGEQQRVAICAALAKQPALLLADEPTGELDATSTRAVIDLLLELTDMTATTGLVVTHDETVANATSRTIHIRDGRLAAEGTSDPVLIVDSQGWLRLPRTLRAHAGVTDRVRAHGEPRAITLVPDARDDHVGQSDEPIRLPGNAHAPLELELVNVARRYSQAGPSTLEGLSHTFAAGCLNVIAGASGSGKTTILNLLAALDRPDAGEVRAGATRIDELDRDAAAAWRQDTMGYLSQHSTLIEFLTARENVAFALTLRGTDPDDAHDQAGEWLRSIGLARLGDRQADRLSGGERRRVMLARALAPNPRILITDEPTAHLDRFSGRTVIELLAAAATENGTTVIAATHDPDLISATDHALLLD